MKINEKKLQNALPPGMNGLKQVKIYLMILSAAIGWSVSYLAKYMTARANLYTYSLTGEVLREGAVIEDFWGLIQKDFHSLDGFLIFYLVMAGTVVYYYLSYYQESKSIYLMRRLPDKWELYRRCITLPLVGIVTGAVIEAGLLLVYYGIYVFFTPKQCLPI